MSGLSTPRSAAPPSVSMVLPSLNEAAHLPATLASLEAQDLPRGALEVIVVDGGSVDGSVELVRSFVPSTESGMSVIVLNNPSRFATAGFNVGIRAARGKVIALGGARTIYPPHLVRTALEVLKASGADVVGGGVREFIPANGSLVARAIACLYASPVGAGSAAYHRRRTAGPVDTVYCGFYRSEILVRLAGLDERFVRGQDAELNSRVSSAGGEVWFDPRLSTDYQFRGGLVELMRRGWSTGVHVGRGWTLRPKTLRLRHVAPLAWFALVVLGAATAAYSPTATPFLAIIGGLYASALSLSALILSRRVGFGAAMLTIPIFAAFHLAYGAGELVGLVGALAKPRRVAAEVP